MRSLVAASVLLVSAIGGLATAGADEPDSPPAQNPQTLPSVAAPFCQPYVAPHPITKTVAPARHGDAARIKHLQDAADHLQAAGLGSLADHVRGLLYAPTAAEPPQEVSRWRPHEGAPQVVLAVKIVEIDEGKLTGLGLDVGQEPSSGGRPQKALALSHPALNLVGPEANLPGLVETLRKDGSARVLSEPTLVTVAGRPASFHAGGEIPLWALDPNGQPILRGERYGTAVDFVPQLTSSGNLRLRLRCEFSQLDRTKTVVVAGKENPVVHSTCFVTACEMKPGQTLVVACPGRPEDGKAEASCRPATVVLVTPQIVEATAALSSPDRFERR